ncbi:NADH:ubiquinone reductase (Na(+)-transporting) subunit C [Fulvivirga lutea]|uniref:Na(+)-translocating NADH-quinone reductase subunit C n=1 Tax=Fulvivirga lutea TaxID=2810512 RepID=A0A974WIF0_9BACT|nr:NADH:ubiquinone reductase (Na(+)-transporting) subunit C [Fulvivirga lutea]QSE99031.1 NADH:ubiquinone reductase (Na(+)-transporting) subunit C [Fulvivirga lutea]
MQQSNGYIILFTAALTIVVGGLLSLASQGLAPAQKKSVELDTKSQILSSVMDRAELAKLNRDEVLSLYDKRIKSLVVDINGEVIEKNERGGDIVAEEVSILKNYKKAPEDRQYPVFKYMNENDPNKVDAYILPLYGAGLWDKIWGYVALKNDLNTIAGASFDHKQETPGLGARISTPEIQNRYVGKEILDDNGNLVSVSMVKGEGNSGLTEHQVDGMSGATITGRGVNAMLEKYLGYYKSYFNKVKSGNLAKI